MNSAHTAVSQYDAQSYLSTLIEEVHRRVGFLRTVSVAHRDDVAQMTIEAFLANPDGIRARYPVPGVWASQKVASMAIDFGRREGAQCGRGARHTRQVGVFDPNDPITQSMFVIDIDPLEALLANEELAPLLRVLNAEDCTLLCLVDGLEYTAREAAGILDITDSCASRRLKRIRRTLRDLVTAA